VSEKTLEKQLETFMHDGKWLEPYEIVKELSWKYALTYANYTRIWRFCAGG
jgi:hypothetical protein